MDPGIMKRNENCFGSHELQMKIVHKGVYKTMKICTECHIARPFRSSHCSDCDNCTLRFDHHCPWIGGCVGKRNYIYFFIFLVILNIKDFYLLVFAIIHICFTYINTSDEEKNNNSWIAKKLIMLIPSLFTIILIGATMLFTTGLFIYHCSLILFNRTTKEEIKHYRKLKIPNPYDRGIAQNCNEFWTRHKSMENNYTVKDLRKKEKIEKKFSKFSMMSSKKTKPKITPFSYSEKEKKLKNKEKKNSNEIKDKLDDKEFEFNSNSKFSKSSIIDNKSSITYTENSSSKNQNQLQNNNQIINEIKNRIKNSKKKNESNSTSEKKSPKNSRKSSKSSSNLKNSSSNNENNEKNLFDNSSDEDISDENDFSNRKICKTSIKNSNLNNHILNKINALDNNTYHKYRLKTYGNNKNDDDLSYKIAQKRLEELSSEITIHEEINQLKSSLSIPLENSCSSSLSQS